MRKLLLWVGIPLLLITTVFIFRDNGEGQASGGNILASLDKIRTILSIVREYYVEEPDLDKLVDAGISGMLQELDPHSTYIPASELQQVNEEFRGDFDGIGIYFEIRNKLITVVSAIPGTPSDRLGLSPGDMIVEIEGESAYGFTNDQVQKKLKGPRGSVVNITVRRPGLDETLDFSITREKIPIYSVDSAFMLDDRTGYIRLTRFSATSEEEVVAALDSLEAQGMTQLLFDLRGNTGGFLQQAFKLADLFLPGGQTIVSTRGRLKQFDESLVSTDETTRPRWPVVMMINQGSASASEILSGAIQDLDRGLVVGETSFGKGLVQRQFDFNDTSAVRVTIARYYTPSGRLIQRPYDGGLMDYYREGYDDVDNNLDEDSTAVKPVYYTRAGRKVYGGGGITPDVRIRGGRLTPYLSRLRTNRVFFDWANERWTEPGPERNRLQAAGFESFLTGWQPDEALIEEVRLLADAKVPFVAEDWEKDIHWVKAYIKREMARVIWGRDESRRVDSA
ncbi:MAG: S41 family peptidase, partial [Candidatus Cloacimonetes bacterium]|nr:S41 family peptidase [Candidatus Cloacimonadota bacterium]